MRPLIQFALLLIAVSGRYAAAVDSGAARTPVWAEIQARHRPPVVFEKILALAERPMVTPEEVEQTFGIHFKPPVRKDGGSGSFLSFGVPGETSTRQSFSFQYFKDKKWFLYLRGIAAGVPGSQCVRFSDALKAIRDHGWVEKRGFSVEHVSFIYDKETDAFTSRIHIANRLIAKPDDCFDYILIMNGAKPI